MRRQRKTAKRYPSLYKICKTHIKKTMPILRTGIFTQLDFPFVACKYNLCKYMCFTFQFSSSKSPYFYPS